MNRVITSFQALVKWWAYLGGGFFLAIVFLTVFSVLSNFLFASPLTGLEDLVGIFMGMAVAMSVPYGELRKTHLRVDILQPYLSTDFKKTTTAVVKVFLITVSSFFIVFNFLGLLQTRADDLLSNILGLRLWYFYAPLLFSLLLWLGVIVIDFFERSPDD